MSDLDPIHLKEKIAACTDFTPDERSVLLECLNLDDYEGKHTYPSNHGPGSDQWATAAWAILDQISPRNMKPATRHLLGGMVAGALAEMYERGRRGVLFVK